MGHSSHSSRVHHDVVVRDDGVLVDLSENVSSGNVVPDFEVDGVEVPLDRSIQRSRVDSTGDVDGCRELSDRFEGSLNSIVDVSHQS